MIRMRAALPVFVACLALAPAQDSRPTLVVRHEVFLFGATCRALAWSHDGALLAAGGDCGEVVLADAKSGERRAILETGSAAVTDVRFSPDGKRLVVVGADLSLWSTEGSLVARVPAPTETRADWSRDGTRLACARDASHVGIYRASDLCPVTTIEVPEASRIGVVAFQRDGARLAIGAPGRKTHVLDLTTGALDASVPEPGDAADLHFLADGRLLRLYARGTRIEFPGADAILGGTGIACEVTVDARSCLVRSDRAVALLATTRAPVVVAGGHAAALHADGVHWARAIGEGIEIRERERLERTIPIHNRREPRAAWMTGDGHFVVLRPGSRDEFVGIDLRTGSASRILGLPSGLVLPYDAGPELAMLVNAGSREAPETRLQAWRLVPRSGSLGAELVREQRVRLGTLHVHSSEFADLDPTGRFLALHGALVALSDPTTPVFELSDHDLSRCRASSQGGLVVAEGGLLGESGIVSVHAPNGRLVTTHLVPGVITGVDISPDGKRLAIVALSPRGSVASLASAESEASLPLAGGWSRMVWLDDGKLVATRAPAADLPELAILDAATGTAIATRRLPAPVRDLHVDRKARRILLTLSDRVLVLVGPE